MGLLWTALGIEFRVRAAAMMLVGWTVLAWQWYLYRHRHHLQKEDECWPEGLVLVESFLSADESAELEAVIESLRTRLASSKSSSYTPVPVPFMERKQSRVMLQFGVYTNANRVENASRLEAMPRELDLVGRKLVEAGLLSAQPDSCCVNLYEPGQWIPAHVDNTKFERPFATVSLCSEQPIVFERPGRRVFVQLPVGSALRVGSAAADDWQHSVPPVTAKRVSLTFRRLSSATRDAFLALKTACEARRMLKATKKREDRAEKRRLRTISNHDKKQRRVQVEDISVSKRSTPYNVRQETGRPETVPAVEREHVWRVYDAIAPQWHGTRYKAWPRVADFARQVGVHGAQVADVGCGNGKNAAAVCENGGICCACDVSRPLLEIAKRQTRGLSYDCLEADATCLPWRDRTFDAALNIAVLHHVSTHPRRILAVREVLRILKCHGRALFYAWAFEQREFEARSGHRFACPDVLVPFHLRTHGEYWDPHNPYIPDHATLDREKNALVLQRYCHVYRHGELEDLILEAAGGPTFVTIELAYYDQGNWAVAITKLRHSDNRKDQ